MVSARDCPPAILGQVRVDNGRAQTGWLGSKGRVGKDRPSATPLSSVTPASRCSCCKWTLRWCMEELPNPQREDVPKQLSNEKHRQKAAGPSQTQPHLLLCRLRSQAGHVARLPQGSDLHSSATTGSRPAGFRPGLWVSQVPIWGIQ